MTIAKDDKKVHRIGYSPEALLVGSDPNVYFVISEYQLSTGFEPAHFALGLEDQEQYRFSPYS